MSKDYDNGEHKNTENKMKTRRNNSKGRKL